MLIALDSVKNLVKQTHKVTGPPTPITPDWYASRKSVERLAELRPAVLAAGHGEPMYGAAATVGLKSAADRFRVPEHGRYVPEPAEFDEQGVRYLPPAPADSFPMIAGVTAATIAIGFGVWAAVRAQKKKSGD